MARVNEGPDYTVLPASHIYDGMSHPVYTLQPQRITALWPVLISRPTSHHCNYRHCDFSESSEIVKRFNFCLIIFMREYCSCDISPTYISSNQFLLTAQTHPSVCNTSYQFASSQTQY